MGWIQRFLHAVANPDIAYIQMTIGILGIHHGNRHAGLGDSGIAGIICLILAFYAFQVLPGQPAGIALGVLAMILFVAEIKVQSHGILGIGGAASLIAGGLLLFDSSAAFLSVSWPVLIAAAAIVLIFFMVVIRAVARAMRRPHATGVESLIGTRGVVVSSLGPQGQVKLQGETWKAKTEEGHLHKDKPVEVLRTEGLTLVVRHLDKPDANSDNRQALRH
jgi:membrane-bound serine protease (ClpP class)